MNTPILTPPEVVAQFRYTVIAPIVSRTLAFGEQQWRLIGRSVPFRRCVLGTAPCPSRIGPSGRCLAPRIKRSSSGWRTRTRCINSLIRSVTTVREQAHDCPRTTPTVSGIGGPLAAAGMDRGIRIMFCRSAIC